MMNEPEKLIRVCKAACYVSYLDIRPYEHNPRINLQYEPDKLADLTQSIIHNSLFRPFLVWWRDDGKLFQKGDILAGNQRYRALAGLMSAGYGTVIREADSSLEMLRDKVPIIRFTGSEERANRIILRDNRESGDWNYGNLAKYIEDYIADDVIHLAGFSESEADDIKSLLAAPADLRAALLGDEEDTEDEKEPDPDLRIELRFPLTEDQRDCVEQALERAMKLVTAEQKSANPDMKANALEVILHTFQDNYRQEGA